MTRPQVKSVVAFCKRRQLPCQVKVEEADGVVLTCVLPKFTP
jgi:hypothetical protein